METLYIAGEVEVSRDESTILVISKGKKHRFPVETLRHLIMTADGTVTTKFIALCGKNGVRVSFFDYHGWWVGSFEPACQAGSGEMKIRQAALLADQPRRMTVAREIIRGAMDNMIETLRYYAYRGKDSLKQPIGVIQSFRDRLSSTEDVERLMGFEGIAKRTYYAAWSEVDERLAFGPRVKRPPNNRVNCLISFMNGIAYSAVRHEIAKTHLDETISVLHAPSMARSSMSLDLSEPFKPVLVDRQIFAMVRKGMLQDAWFEEKPGVCMLSEIGRKAVVERLAPVLDGVDGIRKSMREEAIKLQRHVLGMEDYVAYRSAR
jgi:CRISPR-associated protein Cas1